LLDTCVIAELRKPSGHAAVRDAVAQFVPDDLFVSTLTIGEIVKGVALLAEGRKKRELAAWLLAFEQQFGDRILPVDHDAARIWGEVSARVQRKGTPIPVVDALIAATALSRGFHVMTRNTRDFAATGALVIDPWATTTP
jgi:predicted nucleic acid-binding protein